MMVTGFLRVLAPGVLLLLVTTTVLVQRADATTSSVTPTDGSGTTSSATPTDGTTGTTGSDATPTDSTTGTTGSDATPTDSTTGTTGSDATPTDSTTGTTGSDATPTDSTTDTTGTDTAPTDGTDDDCSAEETACGADDTCASCAAIPDVSSTEFLACIAEIDSSDFESSTAECTGYVGATCCMDDVSGGECIGNAAFDALMSCGAGACSDDTRSCADIDNGVTASSSASARAGGASTVLAFTCAFMVLPPLLLV